jgi:DNA mismatch repair protein MutS2
MRLFPASAHQQLEFDRVVERLVSHCRGEWAKACAREIRIHNQIDHIRLALGQTQEFKWLLDQGLAFPTEEPLSILRELQLLGLSGAVLTGEQWMQIRRLLTDTESVYRWFNPERKIAYPSLVTVLSGTEYEKKIIARIDDVLEPNGQVRDQASKYLQEIRTKLHRKRQELRSVFERIVQKLQKQGWLAEIEESFLNGRRVVAVLAEQKRVVRGILHGESESRRTSFLEPEETIELNNEVFEWENEERAEVVRILRALTAELSVYQPLLKAYYSILGQFDFIRARARLAVEMDGQLPEIELKAGVQLMQARHPLLLLYNRSNGKPTIPLDISLTEENRILLISGPNAGGKTVAMKTIGLIQLMVQSGLLVPVAAGSRLGVFKQLMIQMGDAQSLEFELSTYSSHLLHMKEFLEAANGRTLFFVDEMGSGSDPDLGGAFAEVMLQEFLRKHSMGVVTTHYLNLKVMAGRTPGLMNGAMAFDEKTLSPLYKLQVGKPGSSYTFAIAQRIGLDKRLIDRAKGLVREDHVRLDKLLHRTEKELADVAKQQQELNKVLAENKRLKAEMERVMDMERHRQEVAVLREQNRIGAERWKELKDLERTLRMVVQDWRKNKDKEKAMKEMGQVLFPKRAVSSKERNAQDMAIPHEDLAGEPAIGDVVLVKKTGRHGQVMEFKGKQVVVRIGKLPMQVSLSDVKRIRLLKEEKADKKLK